MLAALQEFIDQQVGAEPFLLIGESYGGYLARAVVRSRPQQVLGGALICPVGEPLRELWTLPALEVLRSEPDAFTGVSAKLVENFSGLAVVHTREALRRYLSEIQPGLDLADWAAMARVEEKWRLREDPDDAQLPAFAGPSLILLGRQDVAVGYADQLRLVSQYPHASVAILDVAGHNLQIEQPELFADLVGEWLERVAGSA